MPFFSHAEKTEPATPRRLEEAQKRGQIAHSKEVQTAFVLLGGLLALWLFGRTTWTLLGNTMVQMFQHLHRVPVAEAFVPRQAWGLMWLFASCVGPILVLVVGAGLLAGALQSKFTTASEALQPRWERLNPVEGLRRIFSARALMPTVVGLVKLLVIVALLYSVVREILTDPIFYTTVNAARIAQFLAETAGKIVLRVGLALVVIAIADYVYQHWQTQRDLMMTREELKEELKHTEGNPLVKAAMRRRRFSISLRRQLMEVPLADVVVTNPTHLAVALRYNRKTMRAPKIVAKGARHNALRIREVARQHGVPVVENKPLARLMYRHGRVGAEIPVALYAAVAEVLAWVYRTNRYRYYAEQLQTKE